jgi:hypothetical protein
VLPAGSSFATLFESEFTTHTAEPSGATSIGELLAASAGPRAASSPRAKTTRAARSIFLRLTRASRACQYGRSTDQENVESETGRGIGRRADGSSHTMKRLLTAALHGAKLLTGETGSAGAP